MKPIFDVEDDKPHEVDVAPRAQPTWGWVRRGGIGLGLLAIALYGFGGSAGWFERPQRGTTGALDAQGPSDEPPALQPSTSAPSGMLDRGPTNSGSSAPTSTPLPLAALIPSTSLDLIEECLRVARHLEQSCPGVIEAEEMRARVEFEFGDIEKARDIWIKILEVEPNYAHALRGVGDVCTLNGQLKEAVTYFRRAVLAEPRDLTRQVTLGMALLQAAELDQSIEVLQRVLAVEPKHVGAHAELAQALSQAGQFASAQKHFESALEQEEQLSDPAKVHFGLATVLRRLGESQLADAQHAAFLKLRDGASARRTESNHDYDDVIAIGQDAARFYVDMARVYWAVGQVGSAELLLLRASRMNPQDVDSRQALAFLSLNQERPHDAIRWLREIAELQPEDFSITGEIARLYVLVDAVDDAEKALLDFVKTHPASSSALRALSEYYRLIKPDESKAVEYARACVTAEPSAENYSKLASALEFARDNPAAIVALQQAVELAPENAVYSQRLALLREIPDLTGD